MAAVPQRPVRGALLLCSVREMDGGQAVSRSEENAPPPDDWRPIVKHCGDWHDTHVCSICAEYVPPIPENIVLGSD